MRTLTMLAVLLALASCQSTPKGPSASAQIEASQGGRVVGLVTFREADGKTTVRADVNGLPPGRYFGFHVHEKGDCSAADFTSAGGHFNPDSKPHGDPNSSAGHHAGDLPNLLSDGQGVAVLSYTSTLLTVSPGPLSVVGRAVVVHEFPDDYRAQPAGNSGPRIACGVIKG